MPRPKRDDNRNARTVANNKYNVAAYDRLAVNVKKGEREKIKKHADETGQSVNGMINKLIADEVPGFDPLL